MEGRFPNPQAIGKPPFLDSAKLYLKAILLARFHSGLKNTLGNYANFEPTNFSFLPNDIGSSAVCRGY
ncbi:MAG: hypothetical protein M3O66_03640 [Verrucomicrobiota bacterium]|nr:hypothetical protein [Verrucomicrobiota bacterium]